MTKAPSRQLDKFIVRLPDGMRARIDEASKVSKRTMNAEIVARLEASFKAEEDTRGLAFVRSVKDHATQTEPDTTIDARLTAIEKQLVVLNEKLLGKA
ncbi:Arc family DNA-binding protein [Sphingobium jiangsuense]|nr:Arc family DNA-binding protein [Sphingobium jiangsuense]